MAISFYTTMEVTGVVKFSKAEFKKPILTFDTSSFNIIRTHEISGADNHLSNSVITTLGTDSNQSLQIAAWAGMTETDNGVKIQARTTNDTNSTEWVTLYDSSNSTVTVLPQSDSYDIDTSTGNKVFNLTLNNPNTSINILPNTKTQVYDCTIIIEQGTGSNLVSWSSNVKWSFNRQVLLSYEQSQKDIISLETYDGGITWYGALIRAGV